jgi:transposase
MEQIQRKAYPSDVTDDEWAFVSPYLTLMREDAEQRHHSLREVFNALRWLVRAGASWRMLPHDLPPWPAVYQQTQRWIAAEVFETIVHDLRVLLRVASGRDPQPTAVILDGRTLQSTPESGHRAGFDGHKKRKGSNRSYAVERDFEPKVGLMQVQLRNSHVTTVSAGSGTRTKPSSFARRVMFCTTRSLY